MTNLLMNEAEDIFFARHSGSADQATILEIEADLTRFVAKVERSDLTASIKKALIKVARK